MSPAIRALTEEYDGLTWSAGGAIITAIFANVGVGSQAAALTVGGKTPTVVATTEEYNKAHSGASYLLTKKIKAQE